MGGHLHIYSTVSRRIQFLKLEPQLQTHFMFAPLVKEESYLSLSVFILFTGLKFILVDMIFAGV